MALLDLLFPKFCVKCKKAGEYICPNCFATISFDTKRICLVCGFFSLDGLTHPACKGSYTINGSFCAVAYKGAIQKLVYQFKYKPYLTDLQTTLVALFYESLIQQELFMKITQKNPVLIPIPLSARKQRSRGYNHAELLSKGLGKKLGIPSISILRRIKETKPQYGLKKAERKENMKGAFEVTSQLATINTHARTAVLVDDILTTGSTMLEAAKVLKRKGFEKVWGVAFAKD